MRSRMDEGQERPNEFRETTNAAVVLFVVLLNSWGGTTHPNRCHFCVIRARNCRLFAF